MAWWLRVLLLMVCWVWWCENKVKQEDEYKRKRERETKKDGILGRRLTFLSHFRRATSEGKVCRMRHALRGGIWRRSSFVPFNAIYSLMCLDQQPAATTQCMAMFGDVTRWWCLRLVGVCILVRNTHTHIDTIVASKQNEPIMILEVFSLNIRWRRPGNATFDTFRHWLLFYQLLKLNSIRHALYTLCVCVLYSVYNVCIKSSKVWLQMKSRYTWYHDILNFKLIALCLIICRFFQYTLDISCFHIYCDGPNVLLMIIFLVYTQNYNSCQTHIVGRW